MICLTDGCGDKTKDGRSKHCVKHAAIISEANVKKAQEKYVAKKKLAGTFSKAKNKGDRICPECKELLLPADIKRKYHPACSVIVSNRAKALYAAGRRAVDKTGPAHIGFPVITPVGAALAETLDTTDYTKQLHVRDMLALGMEIVAGQPLASGVTLLSREQIDALQSSLAIPKRTYESYDTHLDFREN